MRGYPVATPGMRIGLLGGSFDPPHAGHIHITLWALKAFRLQRVWWLVTPGNPLKKRGPAGLERRVAAARALVRDPRVIVTDLEARLGTRATADTLDRLLPRYPGVRFVWLMGSDSFATLHLWGRWQTIPARLPLGVLARPGGQVRAGLSFAARRFPEARVPPPASGALALRDPPAWCLLTGRMLDESSTALRAKGAWAADSNWGHQARS